MTDDSPGADFIDEADRQKALPEHERDDDTSVGGGLMSSGVSADAGAGGDDQGGDPTVATQMVAGTPAVSGSQPMAPVYVEETADEGAMPDESDDRA